MDPDDTPGAVPVPARDTWTGDYLLDCDCGCRFPIVNQGGGEYQCPACLQLWCLPAA